MLYSQKLCNNSSSIALSSFLTQVFYSDQNYIWDFEKKNYVDQGQLL